MTSRRSSGSIRAESAVEPTRSENITVTWRRFGAVGSFWLRWRGRRYRRSFGDSFQQPFAVAERSDAEFLQVGVVELGENCKVDVVLGKPLRVLPETELLQP